MTIIYAIIMICILIFIHELGHFITAKLCGVKVNEFALGMGPVIVQRQKGETMYSLRAIPIGGFCAMEGEDEESDDEGAFNKKPAWKKAIILAAGAFMNLLMAVLLMIIVVYAIGFPTSTFDEVTKGSPAEKAGIITGDKVIEANGQKVDDWYDFTEIVENADKDNKLQLVIERDGKKITTSSGFTEVDGRKVIGVTSKYERNVAKAIVNGPKATINMAKSMYTVLKQLVTGEVSTKDLSGPVGIVYMVDKSVSQGFITFLYFTAMMSLNLAIVNMLPFPALDGGRLIFVVIRKITGKAITDNMEAIVHMVGMILLMLLMVYVTWQDIVRFIVPIFK